MRLIKNYLVITVIAILVSLSFYLPIYAEVYVPSSKTRVVINADINASMQIAKKVDGNIWACPETTCVEALALKPVRIRIS